MESLKNSGGLWVDGWMGGGESHFKDSTAIKKSDGWVDRWMDGLKAILRIAYGNQKVLPGNMIWENCHVHRAISHYFV